MKKLFSILAAILFAGSVMAETVVISSTDMTGNTATEGIVANNIFTKTDSITEIRWTVEINGNRGKALTKQSKITVAQTEYDAFKNSNGAQMTITTTGAKNIVAVDFYATTNDASTAGKLQEFNGVSCTDEVSSKQDGAHPTHITKNLDSPAKSFTFTFGSKQVFFIAIVTLEEPKHNITYATCTNGSVSGPADAYQDATVTVTATPDAGYRFLNLIVDGTALAEGVLSFTMPEADAIVGAEFAEKIDVTGVTLDKSEVELYLYGQTALTATVAPADATIKDVNWSSDNTEVATVENGIVYTHKVGTATITVKTVDGEKTATCAITVKALPSTVLFSATPVAGVELELIAGEEKNNITNEYATIEGGSVSLKNGHASNAGKMIYANMFNVASSGASYIHISLDNALAAGDVISVLDYYSKGITAVNAFIITTTNAKTSESYTFPYVVTEGDALEGNTDLYIWRGTASSIKTINVLREGVDPKKAATGAAAWENMTDDASKSMYKSGDNLITKTATGKHSTICLPYNCTVEGAIVYAYQTRTNEGLVYEVGGNSVAAGVAYIYFATADQQTWSRTDEAEAVDVAVDANQPLVGTYADFDLTAGDYFLHRGTEGDEFCIAGDFIYAPTFRAYIPKDKMPGIASAAVRIVFPTYNPNVTGVEEATAAKATKTLVNGKMVIMRGARTYNINGAKLK